MLSEQERDEIYKRWYKYRGWAHHFAIAEIECEREAGMKRLEDLRERCFKVWCNNGAVVTEHKGRTFIVGKAILATPLIAPEPVLSPFGCKCWTNLGERWMRVAEPIGEILLLTDAKFCEVCGAARPDLNKENDEKTNR